MRTASIIGTYVAVALALREMIANKTPSPCALKFQVAVVSIGIIGGGPTLDLCYEEDSRAKVDFNVVMINENKFIEVQGAAESEPFAREATNRLMDFAMGSKR